MMQQTAPSLTVVVIKSVHTLRAPSEQSSHTGRQPATWTPSCTLYSRKDRYTMTQQAGPSLAVVVMVHTQ